MKYMESYDTIFRAKAEELELDYDYYQCTNCHSKFKLFRPKTIRCQYCLSQDLVSIDKGNVEDI